MRVAGLVTIVIIAVGSIACIRLVDMAPRREVDGDADGDADGDTDGDADGDTDGDADADGDADGDADADAVADGGPVDASSVDATVDGEPVDAGLPPECVVDDDFGELRVGETLERSFNLSDCDDEWTFLSCGTTGRDLVVAVYLMETSNDLTVSSIGLGGYVIGAFDGTDVGTSCTTSSTCISTTADGSSFSQSGLPAGPHYVFVEAGTTTVTRDFTLRLESR